jgi:hypothetical protein
VCTSEDGHEDEPPYENDGYPNLYNLYNWYPLMIIYFDFSASTLSYVITFVSTVRSSLRI